MKIFIEIEPRAKTDVPVPGMFEILVLKANYFCLFDPPNPVYLSLKMQWHNHWPIIADL